MAVNTYFGGTATEGSSEPSCAGGVDASGAAGVWGAPVGEAPGVVESTGVVFPPAGVGMAGVVETGSVEPLETGRSTAVPLPAEQLVIRARSRKMAIVAQKR